MMCRIINKCNNNLCINQTENKKELIEQVKDRECGVICDTLYALRYDKDFRGFLSELEHRKKKIKGGKTLLICRCDKSDPNICRNAGVNQVPCCDCPLNNWPDLCMAIMGSKGCVIVAISCKCRLTSRKYKEPVKVQSIILEEKSKLSSPFEYLLILISKENLDAFKRIAKKYNNNVKVARCYT